MLRKELTGDAEGLNPLPGHENKDLCQRLGDGLRQNQDAKWLLAEILGKLNALSRSIK
jgi:hypothetical protein